MHHILIAWTHMIAQQYMQYVMLISKFMEFSWMQSCSRVILFHCDCTVNYRLISEEAFLSSFSCLTPGIIKQGNILELRIAWLSTIFRFRLHYAEYRQYIKLQYIHYLTIYAPFLLFIHSFKYTYVEVNPFSFHFGSLFSHLFKWIRNLWKFKFYTIF